MYVVELHETNQSKASILALFTFYINKRAAKTHNFLPNWHEFFAGLNFNTIAVLIVNTIFEHLWKNWTNINKF